MYHSESITISNADKVHITIIAISLGKNRAENSVKALELNLI
ncbi:hypothetical protein THOG05_100114 [Vibrio rotiferianus]|nr:hypothetical protein THOG05_100114 [Vibrio rotiferianus]